MDSIRNQRTIAAPVTVEGIGYWSGHDVRVEFRPAVVGTGVVFVRGDLPGCPRIPATAANRIDMSLRTTLRSGDATVEMVEHIMAALSGCQVDNCEVWVDQPEMPGCDGSALPFVAALHQSGIVAQDAPRPLVSIDRPVRLGNEQSWIEARPGTPGKLTIRFDLDYGSGNPIGQQTLEILLSSRYFRLNLAPSRTFLLQHEAAALQDRGFGLRTTFDDVLVFDADGPIGNILRFPDECVRHKIVDMIGDLALAGCDLAGRIVAYRSGHRLNAELVRTILAQMPPTQKKDWKRCA